MGFALAATRLILGLGPNEPLRIEDRDLPDPTSSIALRTTDDYVKLAEYHRPELRIAEAAVAAREREVVIRERMFFPDIGIAGFARWVWTTSATRQKSPFAYDPYNVLGAGVALVTRMTFDVPVKIAQLEQAQAELEKIEIERSLLKGAVRLELQKVHGEVSEALDRARAQGEAEKNAKRWATSAFANFDLGTGDTRELVDAFGALATASGEKIKAWHDVQLGLRALARAVGTDDILLPPPAPRQGGKPPSPSP